MDKGFLITRGLGCSGLLVTRGLGKCRVVIIPPPEEERLRVKGASGRRDDGRDADREHGCIFVNARLVEINGRILPFPIEGEQRVICDRDDTLRVTATMPVVKRRTTEIVIRARIVKYPEDI